MRNCSKGHSLREVGTYWRFLKVKKQDYRRQNSKRPLGLLGWGRGFPSRSSFIHIPSPILVSCIRRKTWIDPLYRREDVYAILVVVGRSPWKLERNNFIQSSKEKSAVAGLWNTSKRTFHGASVPFCLCSVYLAMCSHCALEICSAWLKDWILS